MLTIWLRREILCSLRPQSAPETAIEESACNDFRCRDGIGFRGLFRMRYVYNSAAGLMPGVVGSVVAEILPKHQTVHP